MKKLTLGIAALLLTSGAWLATAHAEPGKGVDCAKNANSANCDLDGDGTINKNDDDIDGDGILNEDDRCPRDATNTCPDDNGGGTDPGPLPPLPPLPGPDDLPPLPGDELPPLPPVEVPPVEVPPVG